MERPFTKANCLGEIHLLRIIYSLLAKAFDMILYRTLQRKMDLKSFLDVGLFTFRIRTMVV